MLSGREAESGSIPGLRRSRTHVLPSFSIQTAGIQVIKIKAQALWLQIQYLNMVRRPNDALDRDN